MVILRYSVCMWRKFLTILLMITLLSGGMTATYAQPSQKSVSHAAQQSHHGAHANVSKQGDDCCPAAAGDEFPSCPDGCDHGAGHCACQHAALAEIISPLSVMQSGSETMNTLVMDVPAIASLPPDRPPRRS